MCFHSFVFRGARRTRKPETMHKEYTWYNFPIVAPWSSSIPTRPRTDYRRAFFVCSWAAACPVYGVLPAIKQVLGGYRTAMKDPFANEV